MEHVYAVEIDTLFSPARSIPTFGALVSVIVSNAVVLAGVISLVILVIGGFSVIMGAGGGDTKRIEQGQKAMTSAIMGLVIVVCSVWIVQIIERITGISLLSLPTFN